MQAEFDFADVMDRVRAVVAAVAPHDSVERYASLGVDVRLGDARIVSPWEIEVRATDGTTSRITTRAIVVATGARPVLPDIPGLDPSRCLTSDTVWNLRELPRRLLVLGGGPVGCELALAFARLGARVAVVERGSRLLGREDPDVSELVARRFAAEGIEVRVDATPLRVEHDGATRAMVVECADGPVHLPFDAVLCALGRVANVDGLGLEALGVRPGPAGTLEVDAYARTRVPNVYAVGDVAGPYRFTHTASHMAWYAAANALARGLVRLRVDWRVVPWCTFVDPEVARVGLNETEAARARIPYEVVRYGLDDLDRAIADGADAGFVKVLTRPGTDRILGATIVGGHAGETIGEFVSAMRHGRGLNAILRTIHIYPTFSEANRHAAGTWRRAHPPARLLALAERWHRWGRG
jgi:pyruvate/2-oxoglutarate dehydrogenase complex dihydrolipoamide dehydrogenase (E3) component